MKAEVTPHSPENLNFLLCGKMPIIRKTQSNQAKERLPEIVDYDFSAFPKEIKQIQESTSRKPRSKFSTRQIPTQRSNDLKKYNELCKDKEFREKVSSYLTAYENNHARKTLQIHRDWEELYMHPLMEEMKEKLQGEEYDEFKETRRMAETSLGVRSEYNPLGDIEASSLPNIKLSTRKCDDRVHKYKKHLLTEKRLTKIVENSNGTQTPKKRKEKYLDFDAWKLLPETRFAITPNGEPIKKGRKTFPERNKCQIDLSQF
ncbi:hypothetical protein GPJ56_006551 [Histomonas meleagridis]|uniref:uncharacterized protein n=1 Tax=Histomonas meleagridis TaxID=135588 RepID=UPI00355A9A98|nr:hypothetical protein GPJ56_006551 [Histomonas meleagridis]KAH0801788.1 hypothetical protein GO595_005469 [Histomonas meleagridis]